MSQNIDLERQSSGTESDKHHSDHNDNVPLSQIKTSGPNNEYVHIAGEKFHRDQFVEAFAGTLVPGHQKAPAYEFANSVPLGLFSHSVSVTTLCLINIQARSVTTPNIVVGLGFFYAGAVMFSCAMWEIARNNCFGATVLGSFAGFWLSYAAILTPSFQIQTAYATTQEFNNALGFYLMCWTFFVFCICLTTVKSTYVFFAFFVCIFMLFFLLTIGTFIGHVGVTKASAVFGIMSGFLGFYNAYAGLADPYNSYFVIHPIAMPNSDKIFFSRKKV